MTTKQQELYDFIKKYIKNHGYSPTIREMCSIFQKSTSTIHSMLQILKRKELISYEDHKSRTIKISK